MEYDELNEIEKEEEQKSGGSTIDEMEIDSDTTVHILKPTPKANYK